MFNHINGDNTAVYSQVALLLRLLFSSGDWLRASVAIERAVNVLQGIKFHKMKSQRVAKRITFLVVLLTTCTYIHDSLYRSLSYDEEQRTWCITTYSRFVQVFDWPMTILHFSPPFILNLISALIIITSIARVRFNFQKKKQSYKESLRQQFQQHKCLLISPCVLIVAAVPRLIITFLLGCMKSAQDASIYLTGYFISFIPSMLTLLVFILPPEHYKKELLKAMK
jgi:hypothetical protein